ncbi:hydroxypyruvate isomerase protein (plasmid) [Rhizobium phaseoli]|uniref:Hydroxypyruvate isomerase family protein n=1 Tax=Rhizobium phaseoli TaxID=396 RepID=A0A192TPR4_9HYPH|nr:MULTISPECIES: 2-oxo-tetronate isomerase [Rhizobium]EGE56254.1 putative hydroxypyruvate isomerase protein [Rhizobium etli CNPAF512]MDH6646014.1 hydroxypyruvate isomerase [Rhizobium esperanzae]ANL31582.1 hydroxypyruvate isomerase protein [Rhizobium phaseoli]ANL44127.1 hydroxypyruvate isomerase protein [Rhizobium phaseoli]ANL50715.1 hydroxypyruvate isomerase protein [Rhizobium phaseoli]
MPVFAANLTMMFNEWDFLDRFDAAADAGFSAVEYLFPYEAAPEAIAERLARNDLQQALFNLPPGDWGAGERGIAALPERFDDLKADVERALDYAAATGVKRLHLMAGIADPHDPEAADSFRRCVTYTAGRLAEKGIDLLLEPINGRNMPGYFLNDFAIAERLIAECGLPNLKLQFDIYHRQILHGDVTKALRRLLEITGHIQIASVPSRNEPDGEELNYPYLFSEIDRLGYDGFIGCEYVPRGQTLDGLGWFKPFARS